MKKATNTKAAAPANKPSRKALTPAKGVPVKKTHTTEVDDYVDTSEYEVFKKKALTAYTTGRDSSYRAMALAYMWYELAKLDEKYIAAEFDKMRTKTLINNYTNTVKCCFNLDATSQAPTISKYARVLGYINEHIDFEIDENSDDDEVVKKVTKLIFHGGGLDACAKAYSGDDEHTATEKNSKPRLSQEDVHKEIKSYKNKRRKALGSFKHNKNLEDKDGELVVMIGRIDTGIMNVVEIIASSDVVEHVIRKK